MPIAQNLRRLRKAAKLSQEALAKKAGVSQQLISQIEREVNSSTKELPDLARALGVAVDAIDESFSNVVEAVGSVIGVKGLIGAGGLLWWITIAIANERDAHVRALDRQSEREKT